MIPEGPPRSKAEVRRLIRVKAEVIDRILQKRGRTWAEATTLQQLQRECAELRKELPPLVLMEASE